jgi:ligand-binding sensor domain-containing protein
MLFNLKAYYFVLLSITVLSCQVQPTQKNSTSQVETKTYTDPMFFIPGQLCQHVREIFEDSRGRLWFGTNVYDVMLYDGDSLRYIGEKEGLPGGRITGILEDKAGNVWFSSAAGLIKYNGRSFSLFGKEEGLSNNEVWALYLDHNEKFWVGTTEGAFQFDGERFYPFEIEKGVVSDTVSQFYYERITAITGDSAGNIWIGTDGFGLTRYNGETFETFTKDHGLPDNAIGDLMIDSKGDLWIGTCFGGVSRFDGVRFHNYTDRGLVHGVEIAGLYEDPQGHIWFCAENSGVYRFDGSEFYRFQGRGENYSNGILSFLKDSQGWFWAGGWGGLFRMTDTTFTPVTLEGPWN